MINILNEHDYDLLNFRIEAEQILLLTTSKMPLVNVQQSLSVLFTNEREITRLNQQYRHHNSKTDVLAFPFAETVAPDYLGDIVICYAVALEQATKYAHSLQRELSFLFLHGLLHLLGYDHLEKEEAQRMFALQDTILNELGIRRQN